MITYKFRAYPSQKQINLFWLHANKLNWLYNYFLDQRNNFKEGDPKITKFGQINELVNLKKNDPTLKDIYSQVLQQVPNRLQKTFDKFYKTNKKQTGKSKPRKDGHPKGYPRFRSCRDFFGICYPQKGFQIIESNIVTKAYGSLKIHKHREILGKVKQISIVNEDDKWYVCIVTNYSKEKTYKNNFIVGIDLGITNIVATSEGDIIRNKNHTKYFDKKINQLQSKRDTNYKKKSRKWHAISKTIQRLYGVKSRKQRDFLHKVSYNLSQNYDTIVREDLNVKEMSEGNITGLNREMRNANVGLLISLIDYKCNNVIKVNPYNTSKMCNNCGEIHHMPLSQRTMRCNCGYVEDRDVNAAKNILCLGQAFLDQNLNCTAEMQEAVRFSDTVVHHMHLEKQPKNCMRD